MAVRQERRQVIFQLDLELYPLAPPLDQRCVGGDAIEPRAEGGPALERIDFPVEGEESILHDLLGIGVASRDADGDSIEPRSILRDETLQRGRIPGAQAVDDHQISVGHHQRFSSCPVIRRDRAEASHALSCSVTNDEHTSRLSWLSRRCMSNSTPSRLTNETLERSRRSRAR